RRGRSSARPRTQQVRGSRSRNSWARSSPPAVTASACDTRQTVTRRRAAVLFRARLHGGGRTMNDRATLSSRAPAVALITLAAVLGGTPALWAQDHYRPAHNEVYLELAGNTIFGLNYGRTLSRSAILRVGAGLVPEVGATVLLMPTLQLGRNSR